VSAGTRKAGEIRKAIERHIHLSRRSAELVPINVFDEVIGQMLFTDHPYECQARVKARGDDIGEDLIAIFEGYAFGLAAGHENLRHWRGRISTLRRAAINSNAPVPPRANPRPERAVDLAHIVVKQNVRVPGDRLEESSDNSRGRHRCF
jgi:hypothetical protein